MAGETGRAETYAALLPQLRSVLEGCPGPVAAMASASALLKERVSLFSWVGFYLPLPDGSLAVGPYQGKLACLLLPPGKGVCQAALARKRTISISDVQAFAGHIACDPASRSEIVVPVLSEGRVVALLDVDSEEPAAFDEADRAGLEAVAGLLAPYLVQGPLDQIRPD